VSEKLHSSRSRALGTCTLPLPWEETDLCLGVAYGLQRLQLEPRTIETDLPTTKDLARYVFSNPFHIS